MNHELGGCLNVCESRGTSAANEKCVIERLATTQVRRHPSSIDLFTLGGETTPPCLDSISVNERLRTPRGHICGLQLSFVVAACVVGSQQSSCSWRVELPNGEHASIERLGHVKAVLEHRQVFANLHRQHGMPREETQK